MPVELRNEQLRVRIDARRLQRQAESLLAAVGRADSTLSILVTDDRRIAPLHKRWMGEPGPTDVMSFPTREKGTFPERSSVPQVWGDIVISAEMAARRRPKDPQREVLRYLVHGLLHLTGQDHKTARERLRMERQARLLEKGVVRK